MNQKVVDYLQENKEKYSKDALQVELQNAGYKEEEIKAGMKLVYNLAAPSSTTIRASDINSKKNIKKTGEYSAQGRRNNIGIWIVGITLISVYTFFVFFALAIDSGYSNFIPFLGGVLGAATIGFFVAHKKHFKSIGILCVICILINLSFISILIYDGIVVKNGDEEEIAMMMNDGEAFSCGGNDYIFVYSYPSSNYTRVIYAPNINQLSIWNRYKMSNIGDVKNHIISSEKYLYINTSGKTGVTEDVEVLASEFGTGCIDDNGREFRDVYSFDIYDRTESVTSLEAIMGDTDTSANTTNQDAYYGNNSVNTFQEGLYSNDEFGFSLAFPRSWNGYIINEESVFGPKRGVKFGFPQQNNLFSIYIYTKQEWKEINEEYKSGNSPMNLPIILGESVRYVYTYPFAYEVMEGFEEQSEDIGEIVTSFELTE
jgi:hypothetical protein